MLQHIVTNYTQGFLVSDHTFILTNIFAGQEQTKKDDESNTSKIALNKFNKIVTQI